MPEDKSKEAFAEALTGRNIPILTLDNKWHRLFPKERKPRDVKKLEKEVTDLLKRQGKLQSELLELKKMKASLMKNIVDNMDSDIAASKKEKALQDKKMEESQRLIREINQKVEEDEDELMDLPGRVKEANGRLMVLSMEYCYSTLKNNAREINAIAKWLKEIRIELKKNILRKQGKETRNKQIYNYMHDIFGPEVIDLFDMQYIKDLFNSEADTTEGAAEDAGEPVDSAGAKGAGNQEDAGGAEDSAT